MLNQCPFWNGNLTTRGKGDHSPLASCRLIFVSVPCWSVLPCSAAIAYSAMEVGITRACAAVVAQGHRREQRQAEEFVADILGKLFAGRDGAEAVGRDKNLDLGQHL